MTTSRRRALCARPIVPALAAALAFAFLAGPAHADPTDPPDPSGGAGSSTADTLQDVAEEALAAVEDLLDPGTTPGPRGGGPADPDDTVDDDTTADLTMALRDLAVTVDDLPKGKQDDARALLARPTDAQTGNQEGSFECAPGNAQSFCYEKAEETPYCEHGNICVHYLKGSQKNYPNAAAPEDDGPGGVWPGTKNNGIPDYVEHVGLVMSRVANRYVQAGYREPVSDGTTGGGSGKFDVYLADLGSAGYYGYCTTDEQNPGRTAAAYCVLDNNYVAREYGSWNTPEQNFKVTAAHEYFHAVQFAYDVREATWLMEGTATWAEDELYTGINDNRQYLPFGPLGKPGQPLGTSSGLAPYGSWIFFRHLSETYPAVEGRMPKIIRQIWEGAAGATSSISSIESAMKARGTNFRDEFSRFATRNRRPAKFYSEGSAYKPSTLWKNYKPTAAKRSNAVSFTCNRKAARNVRFTRTGNLSGSWRLRVTVNLNTPSSGGAAYVTVKPKSGAARSKRMKLNSSGKFTMNYKFGAGIAWVEVTTANAGDSNRKHTIKGALIR